MFAYQKEQNCKDYHAQQ